MRDTAYSEIHAVPTSSTNTVAGPATNRHKASHAKTTKTGHA
jgi:hypothetical protein